MMFLKMTFAFALLLAAPALVAQNAKPAEPAAKADPAKKAVPAPKKLARTPRAKLKGKTDYSKLVDINTASKKDLKGLPGITDALADKIIAGRPYLTKARLGSQGILPQTVYVGIADRIAAGQGGKLPAPAKK